VADVPPQEREQLLQLLQDHLDAFAADPCRPGVTSATFYRINTGTAARVSVRPYRAGPFETELQRAEIDRLLTTSGLSTNETATACIERLREHNSTSVACGCSTATVPRSPRPSGLGWRAQLPPWPLADGLTGYPTLYNNHFCQKKDKKKKFKSGLILIDCTLIANIFSMAVFEVVSVVATGRPSRSRWCSRLRSAGPSRSLHCASPKGTVAAPRPG